MEHEEMMDTVDKNDGNYEDNIMNKIHKQQDLRTAFTKNLTMCANVISTFLMDLYDVLFQNECVSETEVSYISHAEHDSPRDKAQKLVLMITKRSFETMVRCLQYIKPFHPNLVETIYKSFEECKQRKEKKPICCYCFLQKSVKIKEVSESYLQEGFIPQSLHEDILNSPITTPKKWKMLADHFKDSEDVNKAITKIRNELDTTGWHCELVEYLETMREFICECKSLQDGKPGTKRNEKLMQRVPDEQQDKRQRLEHAFRLNKKLLIDNMILLVNGWSS